MNKFNRLTFLVPLFFLLLQANSTNVPATFEVGEKTVDTDSLATIRMPGEETMSFYLTSKDYNYEQKVKPKTWWDYTKEFLLNWLKRSGLGASQLMVLLIVAGAAALIWIIIIVTNTPVKGLFYFSKNSKLVSIPLKAESDINNPELEQMLELFVKHKAYRDAIRINYLLMLKQLHDKQLINWTNHKTNRDYIREMAKHNLLKEFKELTFHFEYSWYGHFDVDMNQFQNISQLFTNFKMALIR